MSWWWTIGCRTDAGTPTELAAPPRETAAPTGDSGPGAPPPPTTRVPPTPNVLVVVLDDIGVDKVRAYGAAPLQPSMPTFERLAAEGVLFRNAYAAPNCSPSRAALYTGRFGRRTGVGTWIEGAVDTFSLPPSEITLPTVLAAAPTPYTTALVGKWHLVAYDRLDPARHPSALGFDDFSGSLGNLGQPFDAAHGTHYYRWEKVVGGALTTSTVYATTDVVDDAIARLGTLPEPFALTVALHAAHLPLQVPPAELLDAPVTLDDPWTARFNAVVSAADRELGRLLDSMDPTVRARTTVFVFADNGTDGHFVLPPFDRHRCKGTVFDGGARVPFVVTGPQVTAPGSVSDALISVVDVLPTLAELAHIDLPAVDPHPLDGVSFLPRLADPSGPGARAFVYAEVFRPNGPPPYPPETDQRMLRDATHKLIRDGFGQDRLYRYDPAHVDEGPDLLALGPLSAADRAALERLRAALDRQVAALVYEGPPAP